MKDSGSLLDTVVKLMNFGAAGVGVIVMLFVFFIVIRGRQADQGMLDLSKMLLRYGFGFAALCALLALFTPWMQPRPVAKPAEMLLSFSPNFASEKLPNPKITLPNGDSVGEGDRFLAEPGQVLVRMDDALKAVKELKQTVQALAVTATAAQKQADAAVEALTVASGADGATKTAQAQAISASRESQANTSAIASSVAQGDFANLAKANRDMDAAAKESFQARSAVIRSAAQ